MLMSITEKIKSFITGEKPEKEEKQEFEETKHLSQECALCGKPGAEKKWAGKYWHKKCFRSLRGKAKGMI
jgi:hypothetical protein